ncbi:AAA domain-containing protein [Nocardia inohanensis]|uniref:AAA domain-containing protein n=1 Tax=Nocardia inohanensis TaxID=209246 RepID=UPI0009FC156C|nr:AAA domain-containing protein [Nocardia inohanensis]
MSDEIPYPIPELIRALRAEVAAELQGDGGRAVMVTLRRGKRSGGSDERPEYVFETKTEQNPLNGTQVLVRTETKKQWVRGEAVWEAVGRVRLTTEAELGSGASTVTIRDDETLRLEQLIERLQLAGKDGRGRVDLDKAGWMVGGGNPAIGREGRPDMLVAGYRALPLNSFQRQAVEQALGSEVTFVWGPPGTGKTEVVSRIVEGCYRQGHTVLFLAPTNIAVDQAVERLCELLSRESGFETGLLQRAGRVTVPSLNAKFGEFIVSDRIVGRLSGELSARQSEVATQLERARQDLEIHERTLALTEQFESLRKVIETTPAAKREVAAKHAECVEDIGKLRGSRDKLGIPSGMRAQWTQHKLDELNRKIARQEAAAAEWSTRVTALSREFRTACAQFEEVGPRLQRCQRLRQGLPSHDEVRAAVEGLGNEHRQLGEQLSKIEDLVRAGCRVLGTTVAKAVQSRRLLDEIDVVVIDEAGMVDLPSAWYLAGLARKRVVVAGDFRQLPAVTQGSGNQSASPDDRAHSAQWMDRDVFHAAGLVDAGGSVLRDRRLVRLVEQYRMRPAICAVVNEVAYRDAPLTTGRGDTSALSGSLLLESPLILVDTSEKRKALGDRFVRGGHRTNAVHEAVIHELVRGLQADGVLPAYQGRSEGSPTERLAVIAPYRDQVKVLQDSISHRFGVHFDGLVDTVHRFQGSQRPVVIIDTVAGASDIAGYFYAGIGPSSTTCRLLNVALSRAQDHLMVVADVEFLERTLPAGSETVRMLHHLRAHAQVLPVGDLVPVRMASELAGLPDRELVRPAFFPKDEVRRAVEWDIERAAHSIEIYCAFLDPAPVDFWLERFRKKLVSGVKVVIHTRDQKSGSKGESALGRLRRAGCDVDTRPHMHEKVLIVDNEVLWHGSLNLLAGSGPTDLMMRITSRASCDRVRKIMARARSERSSQQAPVAVDSTSQAVAKSAAPTLGSRPNKYDSTCVVCGKSVLAGNGELGRENDKWIVKCRSH